MMGKTLKIVCVSAKAYKQLPPTPASKPHNFNKNRNAPKEIRHREMPNTFQNFFFTINGIENAFYSPKRVKFLFDNFIIIKQIIFAYLCNSSCRKKSFATCYSLEWRSILKTTRLWGQTTLTRIVKHDNTDLFPFDSCDKCLTFTTMQYKNQSDNLFKRQ